MEPKLITNTHSRAVGALVLAFLVVALVLASSMPSAMADYTGMAISKDFKPDDSNWQYSDASESCPTLDENFSLEYRRRYWWAEFCGSAGPYRKKAACLKCLQVLDAATADDDNPVTVTLRVVGICDNSDDGPVILMDTERFKEINHGSSDGKLKVNYDIDECEDDDQ